MHWFHRSKLERITQERRSRRAFAEEIWNAAHRGSFYAIPGNRLEETLRAAKREDTIYEETLGEPLPPHMHEAVVCELFFWMTLHDLLIQPPVSDENYPALCRHVRPYVALLIDLLHAEEEMMTNPLIEHYRVITAHISDEAARLRPTSKKA